MPGWQVLNRSSIIGLSFLAILPGYQQRDDFLVRHGERGGLGRGRLGLALDVANTVEEDLDRAPIGCG